MKLNVFREVKKGSGTCDWCSEKKEGFKSEPIKVPYVALKENTLELKWLRSEKVFSTTNLYWVIEPEAEVRQTSISSFICKDCVKQLAKP